MNKSTKPKSPKNRRPTRATNPVLTAADDAKRPNTKSPNTKSRKTKSQYAKFQTANVSSPRSPARANSKLATMIGMLHRKEGATIEQLSKATGWQFHSVRGALSGAIKKRMGLTVSSSKTDSASTYRIAG